MQKLVKWLRKHYHQSIHSIGFFPGLMAFLLLAFFVFIYAIEYSDGIEMLKRRFSWLNIRNTEAARTIVSTVTTGIIGLTVFSFSMVMLVMSQAASQISNRILDNFIGDRFQQITLGTYIGTILVSFFLLSVIDDKGVNQVPSISVLILVVLTLVDLFLFISFLHYITQSIRYEQLIKRLHKTTETSLNKLNNPAICCEWKLMKDHFVEISSPVSSYFQGINKRQLIAFAKANDLQIEFLVLRCSHVLEGDPLLRLYYTNRPDEKVISSVMENIDFYTSQEIDKNPFYGFLHLSEVAIKALSPGINDPNTAVLGIHALTDLLSRKMQMGVYNGYKDQAGVPRIFLHERSFEDIFRYCVYPILDYGLKDRFVVTALYSMVIRLRERDTNGAYNLLLSDFEKELNKQTHSDGANVLR